MKAGGAPVANVVIGQAQSRPQWLELRYAE